MTIADGWAVFSLLRSSDNLRKFPSNSLSLSLSLSHISYPSLSLPLTSSHPRRNQEKNILPLNIQSVIQSTISHEISYLYVCVYDVILGPCLGLPGILRGPWTWSSASRLWPWCSAISGWMLHGISVCSCARSLISANTRKACICLCCG